MRTFRKQVAITCAGLALLSATASAKRAAPKPVTPIISRGIRYSAGGDGKDEYVIAADASSGSILWKAKVCHNHIERWKEEDVQWFFITDLKLDGNFILVKDEKARCYSVDLTKKNVKDLPCNHFKQ
jgi:hypothetical protein